MHSDTLNGSGQQPVQAGYPRVAQDEERYGAVSNNGDDNAKGHGIRRIEQEDQRGRDQHPASIGDAGDDTGRGRWHQCDLFGPAVSDGGDQFNGRDRNAEQVEGEPESRELTCFRIPTPTLDDALTLGADVGLVPVIEATADETHLEVYQKLFRGDQQFWVIAKSGAFIGSVVTQIEQRSTDKVLVVKYMAGKTFRDWLDVLHKTMSGFGKEMGCTAMETHSREALRKPLVALGWSKVAVLYRAPLDG